MTQFITLFINSIVAILIVAILVRSIVLAFSSNQSLSTFVAKIKSTPNDIDLTQLIQKEVFLGSSRSEYVSSFISSDSITVTNINARECFYIENITDLRKSLGLLKLNASAFVSIGVLGTFTGLALGIGSLKFSADLPPQDLVIQIGDLLKNVSSAFFTSIFGLVGSLLALFSEKLFRSRFEHQLNHFSDFLDEKFINIKLHNLLTQSESVNKGIQSALTTELNGNEVSPANLVAQLLEFNKRQTDSLESFSSELAFSIEDLFNKVFNDDESTFRKEFSNIAAKLTMLSESLRSPAEDMTKNVVEELQNSLRTMIEEFQTSISDGARQEMDELTKQLSHVSSSLSSIPTVLGELQNSTESSILKINSQMEDSARIIGEETTESVNQLSMIIGNLVSEIQEIQERQLSLTKGQTESFEKMSVMSEKFKRTLEDLDSLSDEIAEAGGQVGATADILKNTSTTLHKAAESVENSNQALNSTLTSFISETSSLIGEQTNLTSNILEVIQNIKTHSITIKEKYSQLDSSISESFESVQVGIDKFLSQIKDSNDGYLNDYANAVNSVSNSLAQGADEIRQAMDEISESFDSVIEKLNVNETE